MATLAADYVFNPGFMAGFYGQFDAMDQNTGTPVNGKGWMIGTYAMARLGSSVFWQGRAGWGKSANETTPTSAGTESFASTRWLLSSSLAVGQMETGSWLVLYTHRQL